MRATSLLHSNSDGPTWSQQGHGISRRHTQYTVIHAVACKLAFPKASRQYRILLGWPLGSLCFWILHECSMNPISCFGLRWCGRVLIFPLPSLSMRAKILAMRRNWHRQLAKLRRQKFCAIHPSPLRWRLGTNTDKHHAYLERNRCLPPWNVQLVESAAFVPKRRHQRTGHGMDDDGR